MWSFVEEGRGLRVDIRQNGGVIRGRVDTELLSFPATEAKGKKKEKEKRGKKEKGKSLNRPKQEKVESAEKEGKIWRCDGERTKPGPDLLVITSQSFESIYHTHKEEKKGGKKRNKNIQKIQCNDGDSNPDLEHGKLEFYP